MLLDYVRQLSIDQKVRLLTGADFWSLPAEPAIGLRRLVMSDGPAGVRGELWDERDPSVNIPSATALAATWDIALVKRLARVLASECRRKEIDVLLAPTVNIQRTPYAGRHFEMFSEDPLLTAMLGAAYVEGLQSEGTAAMVKHFVANESETDRFNANMVVDERTLREVYLAPFEHIVKSSRAWAVMAAYNQTNGIAMTESPMLRTVLQEEWAYDGVTVTDWFAGRSTEGSANSALDVMMPGPAGPWGPALLAALHDGKVAEKTIDQKVLRLLRLAGRVGALLPADEAPPASPLWSEQEVASTLRSAAAASFVLLRNTVPLESADPAMQPLLPLDSGRLATIALLGPNAAEGRTLGGGAALVLPAYTVSPLAGLTAALGPDIEITHAPGVRAHTRLSPARVGLFTLPGGEAAGVEVRLMGTDGTVLETQRRLTTSFTWQGAFGEIEMRQVAAVQVRARLVPEQSGLHVIGCSGTGRFVMEVGTALGFDVSLELPEGADPAEGMMRPPQHGVNVALTAGEGVDVTLVYEPAPPDSASFDAAMVSFHLNLEPPVEPESVALDRAVHLASQADVAIVVVGTNEEVESEGFDRVSLALPGAQDELVRRVAGANPRTVVVVNSGAPVLLPWRDDVAAILHTWFPGQEFGNALADVLLGIAEPGGRLPTTWPEVEGSPLPSPRPVDGVVTYAERLNVGYRGFMAADVTPAYWFGHGLGYTTWGYGDARLEADGGGGAVIDVTVTNTGSRPGREVVQVYASKPSTALERPTRWLAGFAVVDAEPGEEVSVAVHVDGRAFEHWDVASHRWSVESGDFELHVARSADLVMCSTWFDPAGSIGGHPTRVQQQGSAR